MTRCGRGCWWAASKYPAAPPGCSAQDRSAARDPALLTRLGVTHVLNTAEGWQAGTVNTSQQFYSNTNIVYKAQCTLGPAFLRAESC